MLVGTLGNHVFHPKVVEYYEDWSKFRCTYEGGQVFKNRYLQAFSKRESSEDFQKRTEITYVPAFAQAGIDDVKNSIFQRMTDIIRVGGPRSYQNVIDGSNGGVDFKRNSMTSFIGFKILPELLVLGKVGVYIDKPPKRGPTLKDNVGIRPYLYVYRAEDIHSWDYDLNGEFRSVLLCDNVLTYDDKTKMPNGYSTQYRHLWVEDNSVLMDLYDSDDTKITDEPIVLNMSRIPFVQLELSCSLMKNIADYQIAHMNLASSDMFYALSANFPFYVEQGNVALAMANSYASGNQGFDSDGSETGTEQTDVQELKVGTMTGRMYPMNTDRPDFIHPSSEPMKASMEKQEKIKEEIRQLLNLTISNLRPVRASAESKQTDDRTLENGLSYIGLELEYAERMIGEIWAEYEHEAPPHVSYPNNYQLRTDDDRREEAKKTLELLPKVPSRQFQLEMAKAATKALFGGKMSVDTLNNIYKEIDASDTPYSDPEVLWKDIENGLVSKELASKLRGYPEGQVTIATKEHAERASAIAMAQASVKAEVTEETDMMGARGVDDMSVDKNEAQQEKKASRDTTMDPTVKSKVRGKGVKGGRSK